MTKKAHIILALITPIAMFSMILGGDIGIKYYEKLQSEIVGMVCLSNVCYCSNITYIPFTSNIITALKSVVAFFDAIEMFGTEARDHHYFCPLYRNGTIDYKCSFLVMRGEREIPSYGPMKLELETELYKEIENFYWCEKENSVNKRSIKEKLVIYKINGFEKILFDIISSEESETLDFQSLRNVMFSPLCTKENNSTFKVSILDENFYDYDEKNVLLKKIKKVPNKVPNDMIDMKFYDARYSCDF
ncbi:MAG: hypothetical protein RsTaC01_0606 [Candidatus Paraimprobicoccus trichonymphae]|uniref:Uncharacterized protein n=1 Tax=Candidatus Paraimprobicoccus trichonymphae TaxID=3033793 RepID=A0AA48HWJ5_9FIRM|nr:MAG: hypothetical protein RsTaC01_0606 [Candidatus Paraimprobicoccus trichonymphae]